MPSKSEELSRRRLIHYMADIRSRLRMDNWDLVLHEEFIQDEDSYAETWQNDNHHVLNIRICEEFFSLEPAGVRNTVIHELTHAQHRDINRLWDRISSNQDLSKSLYEAWNEEYRVNMERFVSWVTDRIENQMPMWDPTGPAPAALPAGCYLGHRHS